ncbi:alpha/beta hydrolase [Pseudomonas cichorii]|uniref:alpha/beta hydrolase n=1 Tax=Pseudomonas cichorii TaxID=36746 RepID=UPI001C896205|nr:alpha/beta hydrolase [Pseudomonas cichorii]MBX8486858.1 alpha/beta hydrolase [Pseudomonas cichorii]
MNTDIKWFVTASVIMLVGCMSDATRTLDLAEKELGTDGSITMHYHSALYYPEKIALQDGGYLVGIEKGYPGKIFKEEERIQFKDHGTKNEEVIERQKTVQDNKIMFVSHVIHDQFPGAAAKNCTVYNAYYRGGSKSPPPPIRPCIDEVQPKPAEVKKVAEGAYISSWQALDALQDRLSRDIATSEYTHILVVVMGWNTVQEEAVRNINSIVRGIKHAAKGSGGKNVFEPLVIGVTWPSQWNSVWLDPLYKLASFDTKARDADEVGLTWLGVLLEKTIPQANSLSGRHLPVIAIGHSFGARALNTAACLGPVISNGVVTEAYAKQTIDLVINYQGAFLIDHLLGEASGIEFKMTERCPSVKSIALTSAERDTAVDTAIWGKYAGNDTGFKKYCAKPAAGINCVIANPEGGIDTGSVAVGGVTYIDASDLIFYNAFYTGGGSHSDIYRDEHGVLSWSLIKKLAANNDDLRTTKKVP